MQDTRWLIDIVAGIQETVPDLKLARNDVGVRPGEMLVRRCRVALFPMMQGCPSAGLAADPQHFHSGHRGLLNPRCLGPHERVLNVLEDGSDILRKRHVCSSPLDRNCAGHDKPPRDCRQGTPREVNRPWLCPNSPVKPDLPTFKTFGLVSAAVVPTDIKEA